MNVYRIRPETRGTNCWYLERRVLLFWWRYLSLSSSVDELLKIIDHAQSDIRIIHRKPNRVLESA